MNRLAIVLTKDFADWETGIITGGGAAFYGLVPIVATPGGTAVSSMGGVSVIPSAAVEDLDPDQQDALVICGGTVWESSEAPDLTPTVRAFADAGRPIGAICGGTLALARAGLLDCVAHTSNHPGYLQQHVSSYRGAEKYRNQPRAIADAGIVTAAGTSPASFAEEVFRAVGVPDRDLQGFRAMMAAEHAA